MDAITATPRPHPLLLLAAASLTVLSFCGVAALAGWLPLSKAANPVPVADTAPVPVIAPAATTPPATVTPTAPARKKLGAGEAAPKVRASTATPKEAEMPTSVTSPGAIEVIAAAPPVTSRPIPACADCGVVQSIEEIPVAGQAGNTGAVLGGVVGGILGNQIGKGASRDIATLLGIAGGAFAGHQIEKANSKAVRYEVVVRLEDGSIRRIASETPPLWRSGDRVQIQNGELISRG